MNELYKRMQQNINNQHKVTLARLDKHLNIIERVDKIKSLIISNLQEKNEPITVTNDETIPIYFSVLMGPSNTIEDAILCADEVITLFPEKWDISVTEHIHGISTRIYNIGIEGTFTITFSLDSQQRHCQYVDTGKTEPIMEWRCMEKVKEKDNI